LKRSTYNPLVALLLLLLVGACSDNDPANPAGSNDYFSATVNGVAFSGSASRYATYANQVLSVGGTNGDGRMVTIALANITAVGTYSLSPNNPNAAIANVMEGSPLGIWASNITGGSGTLTVTTFSLTRMAGSFSFVAVPANASASGTAVVTNGSFDLPL
jgi:hypothetical protein